jgi:hypothetical protein
MCAEWEVEYLPPADSRTGLSITGNEAVGALDTQLREDSPVFRRH